MTDPPDSPWAQDLDYIVAQLAADTGVQDWFGLTTTPFTDPSRESIRRKIYTGDNGRVDPATGRKLCVYEFRRDGEQKVMNGRSSLNMDTGMLVAVVVYVHAPNGSDFTAETRLAGNLHDAVVRKVLKLPFTPGWVSIYNAGPYGLFEGSQNQVQFGCLIAIEAKMKDFT